MTLELSEKLVAALETVIPIDAWALATKHIGYTTLTSVSEGFVHQLRLNDGEANWTVQIETFCFTTLNPDFQDRVNALALKAMQCGYQRIKDEIKDLDKKIDKLK